MKLELENVVKSFDNNESIIASTSLTFTGGTIYGFIGRNGSGKTVLFKLICGLMDPTKGKIMINGFNLKDSRKNNIEIRALIEKPKFIPNLTGKQNLELLASIQKKVGQDEISQWLKLFGLFEQKDKKYEKYSLGTKQKLGIIQAFYENPNIILLDEPFNGIDDESFEQIKKIIANEKQKGKIILISSHMKDDLKNICDTLYRIDNGKVNELP